MRPFSAFRRFRSFLAAIPILVAICPPASAETTSPLDDFVAAALAHSPALAAASEEVVAREALVPGATLLPDPMVSFTYQNEGWKPNLGEGMDTFAGVMVSQPLPASGKRELTGRLAEAEVAAAKASLEVLRRTMAASMRRALVELAVARASLSEIDTRISIWESIEDAARVRYADGLGSQSDLLMAQTERTRLVAERDEAEARVRIGTSTLARIVAGIDLDEAIERLPSLDAIPVPDAVSPELAAARAEEGSPWLAEARSAVDRATRSTELADRSRRPDLTANAAYMNRGSMDPMISVGVSATIPLWRNRRQDAAVTAAEARRRSETARLERLRHEIRGSASRNALELSAALARIRTTEAGVLVQQRLATESAIVAFRNGTGMFAAVFAALDRLAGDERTAIAARGRALVAAVALDEMAPGGDSAGMDAGRPAETNSTRFAGGSAQGGM